MNKIILNEFFVQINKNVINSNISDNAFRVYSFCVSKPIGWKYFIKNIAKEMNKSESTIKRAFQELKEVGLLNVTIIDAPNSKEYLFNFETQSSKMNGGGFKNERGGGFKNDLHNNKEYKNIYNKSPHIKNEVKNTHEHKILDKPKSDFLDLLFINFDLAHLEVTKQPFISLSIAKEKSNLAKIFNFLKTKNYLLQTSDWQNYIKADFVNILKIALEDNWLKNNLTPSSIVTKINDINLKLSQTEYKTRKIEEPYQSVWS